MELNLGRCHYGDFDEEAVAVAALPDGGWIAVCEEHKQRAAEEGYEVREGGSPDGSDAPDESAAGDESVADDGPAADDESEADEG